MSASAHKFNGPQGCSFLYVKHGTPILPFHHGGQQEAGLRAGTENVTGIIGMATAGMTRIIGSSSIIFCLLCRASAFFCSLRPLMKSPLFQINSSD